MSEQVIIRLGRTHDAPVVWAHVADGAIVASGTSPTLQALAATPGLAGDELRVYAVLPGEQVAMRSLPTPPRQQSKLLSAAGLLLEDELASSSEDQHIAVLKADECALVTAVERKLITSWLARFQEAGLELHALAADFQCLGGTVRHGVLFVEPNRLMADFGERGFAAEADIAKLVVADYLVNQPDATLGLYSAQESLPDNDRYERLGDANDEKFLLLAAKAIEEGRTVNFLQGEFRERRSKLFDGPRLRRPAMMAAGLAGLLFSGVIADGFRAERLAERYESEARRIHDEAFPTAQGEDIGSHARRILGSGGGASFLAISDVLGRALQEHDNVAIDRVRFDKSRSAYVFSVRSSSDSDITQFQRSLTAMGASASETGGYRRSGAFWVGEMTVTL